MRNTVWEGKNVLITGHTGFKGSWLSLWLKELGAKVHGISLDPPTQINLFSVANIKACLASDIRLDIRDLNELTKVVHEIQPEVVFHLAAQPLVQYSYEFPIETYSVNVMGTAHVFEAIRACNSVHAAVIVTTDKCYENREWIYSYREIERLGGADPYSSSKACAELITAAYRSSYLNSRCNVATARAGNVIGGGDWAMNRLLPDCIRAYCAGNSITLRYPQAIRPWQHVLESINGYILLAENLIGKSGSEFAESWNFGPNIDDMKSVNEVARMIASLLKIPIEILDTPPQKHEANVLRLDSIKARQRLSWRPRWSLQEAIDETIHWYQFWINGADMFEISRLQIARYLQKESVSLDILCE